jgi:hypothetical protein
MKNEALYMCRAKWIWPGYDPCCIDIHGTPITCTLICIKVCQDLFVGYILKYIFRLILEFRVFFCGHT